MTLANHTTINYRTKKNICHTSSLRIKLVAELFCFQNSKQYFKFKKKTFQMQTKITVNNTVSLILRK